MTFQSASECSRCRDDGDPRLEQRVGDQLTYHCRTCHRRWTVSLRPEPPAYAHKAMDVMRRGLNA